MRKISLSHLVLIGLLIAIFPVHASDTSVKQARLYDVGTYVTDLSRTEAFYKKVFGLKVVRRWDMMSLRTADSKWQDIKLLGIALEGSNGMQLEFLQRGNPAKRQIAQEPINHFALEVVDVQVALDTALSLGATHAFPKVPVQYIKIGNFGVINTQIIGLDGERIQILRELTDDEL
jgi:catechol 2,3-dioxygenase-like lactoylglutathione lyase family enzyme